MPVLERHLHAVPATAHEHATSELGEVGLVATIFAVALLPMVCDLAGIGRWDGASLGLGTLGVLLAGRALGAWLMARARGWAPRRSRQRSERRQGAASSAGQGPRGAPQLNSRGRGRA